MEQQPGVHEVWDKKKIITAFLFFALIFGGGFFVKTYILDAQNEQASQETKQSLVSKKSVKGSNTEKEEIEEITPTSKSILPSNLSSDVIQEEIQKKIEVITKQVSTLSPQEMASSSPQVKKILKDIEALKEYPKNQAKEACLQVCSNL